jgi:hypothetical protein
MDFVAALVDSDRNVEKAVAEGNAKMDQAEKKLRVIIEAMQNNLDHVERGVLGGMSLDVDRVLTIAEQTESEVRDDFESVDRTVTRLHKMLRRRVPGWSKSVDPMIARFHSVGSWYWSELQECRWRLLALRAEYLRHREEKGPVFSNPKDLARHLNSLS